MCLLNKSIGWVASTSVASESLIPETRLQMLNGFPLFPVPGTFIHISQVEGTGSRELADLVGMTLRVEQYFLTTGSQIISPFKRGYC